METHNTLLEQLQRRYATKKFDSEKKISESEINVLLESLRLSPSSLGLQGRGFVVVESKDIRVKLKPYSRDQAQITDASHLIVLCRTLDMGTDRVHSYIQKIADVRGMSLEALDGYKKMILGFLEGKSDEEVADRLTKQVYIALGFLLSSCAQLGIDACPMEGFDPKKYDEILGLKEKALTSCVVVAVGYRHPDDTYATLTKVRFDKKDMILMK